MLGLHGGDCRYYTIYSFNNNFSKDKNSNLSIISFNIGSFHKNCEELIGFLKKLKYEFKYIIITETWLLETNINLCNLDGYIGVHSVCTNKPGGGVSLFIHESLLFKLNNNLPGIYRPPGSNLNSFSDTFLIKIIYLQIKLLYQEI